MRLKDPLVVALGVSASLLSGLFVGRSTRAVAQTEPSAVRTGIEQLFRERYDTADRGYTLSMIGHQPGKALDHAALNWLVLRANARRALRESKADRIAFVREFLRQLQSQEAFEERLKQKNLVDADTVLYARYQRLDAQIWLAQEEKE